MIMKYILIMLFTLAGLAGMAQTNEPLPSGAVQFSNQLWLNPSDSTIWTGDAFDGKYVNLGSWHKVDSLFTHGVYDVEGISELEAFSGQQTAVVVRDTLRGGLFTWHENGNIDGGTVFPATGKGSGYWHRVFNEYDGLNVLWYGADPTGVLDNSDIIESIIVDFSYKTGKVFIPKGRYKIESTIGDVGAGSVRRIKNDVEITGEKGAVIFVDSPIEISSVIGFDIESATVKISNIYLDGVMKANRGIYIRHGASGIPASNLYVYGVTVKNIYIGSGAIENGSIGIQGYGKLDNYIVDNVLVDSVISANGLPTKGIGSGGPNNLASPVYSEIVRSTVKNIYKTNEITYVDQDGIALLYGHPIDGTTKVRSIVRDNVIVNARGRFIKIQQQNVEVSGNLMMIEPDFVMPSTHLTYGIDIQYSDGVVSGNTFVYNNLDKNVHKAQINFSERSADIGLHRAIAKDNKVVADSIGNFAELTLDAGSRFTGPVIISDNYVNAGANRVLFIKSSSVIDSVVRVIANNNTVSSIRVNFIGNPSDRRLNLAASNNVILTGTATVSDFIDSLTSINNTGLIQGNVINGLNGYVNTSTNQVAIGGNKDWTGTHTFGGNVTAGGNPAKLIIKPSTGSISYMELLNSEGIRQGYIGKGSGVSSNLIYENSISGLHQFNQSIQSPQYRLSSLNTAPASATDTGTTGEIRFGTDGRIYVCTGTNTWIRSDPLTTW